MEELSRALQGALDMSSSQATVRMQCSQHPRFQGPRSGKRQLRRRRNRKRRLDPNPIWEYSVKFSDDSDSTLDEALKDYMENVKSFCLDNSDSAGEDTVMKRLSSLNVTSSSNLYGESDSFGEGLNGTKRAIRKKKSRPKRMAIDGAPGSCLATCRSCPYTDFIPSSHLAKRRLRKVRKKAQSPEENGVNSFASSSKDNFSFDSSTLKARRGKEKLSHKMDLDPECKNSASSPERAESSKSSQNTEVASSGSQARSSSSEGTMCSKGEYKDKKGTSSDDESDDKSSDSSEEETGSTTGDDGLFTNDEGREGDDEQSDFFYEGGGSVSGIPQVIPWWEKDCEKMEDENKFSGILNGSFPLLSKGNQRNFNSRLRSLQKGEDCSTRNFRARLKAKRLRKPPVSILNENVVHFLRNPRQRELHLKAMKTRFPKEREPARFSLDLTMKDVTKKSGKGKVQKIKHQPPPPRSSFDFHMASSSTESDLRSHMNTQGAIAKRRKKSTPVPIHPLGLVGSDANPIPDNNVGNKMLQNMGWKPGTGLGSEGQGRKDPVQAFIRPRNRGLGHWKPK